MELESAIVPIEIKKKMPYEKQVPHAFFFPSNSLSPFLLLTLVVENFQLVFMENGCNLFALDLIIC